MRRDSHPPRMGDPLPVHQEDIRHVRKLLQGLCKRRQFPERQQSRNVKGISGSVRAHWPSMTFNVCASRTTTPAVSSGSSLDDDTSMPPISLIPFGSIVPVRMIFEDKSFCKAIASVGERFQSWRRWIFIQCCRRAERYRHCMLKPRSSSGERCGAGLQGLLVFR